MTQSDITIERLADVGASDAAYLVSKIRTIPGFPKEGIKFRDFMPVLADGKGLRILMKALQASLPVTEDSFDAVAGLEARGFLFGPALAAMLGKGFIAIRKAGKLPPETIAEEYDLEYGTEKVEIETSAIRPGDRVLIVDDLIATGGTAKAAMDLVEAAGGTVVGFSFVMGLRGLDGLDKPCVGTRRTAPIIIRRTHHRNVRRRTWIFMNTRHENCWRNSIFPRRGPFSPRTPTRSPKRPMPSDTRA